jgi:nucleotide-binding universal stress UspA family protein
MQYFRKILVGVPAPGFDDRGNVIVNPAAAAAIEEALLLAAMTSCSVTLISVVAPAPAEPLSSEPENKQPTDQALADAQHALDAVVAGLDPKQSKVTTQVVCGQPWHELCVAVLRDNYDLVVAGTQNADKLQRRLLGGTGMKLLKNCPCPVWIVKPRDQGREEAAILVATQLDETGLRALRLGVDGSSILDAHVRVLHAIDFESDPRRGTNPDDMHQYRKQVRSEREEAMHAAITQTDHRATPYGVEPMIAEGRPYTCILDAIAEHNIDLLIMGTIGHGGLPGALTGSTAEHLMSEVPCSILAVKPDDFTCSVILEDSPTS